VSQVPVYISCPKTIESKHLPHQYLNGHVIHAIAWMMALALFHKFSVAIHHQPLSVY
jgi:hypothetical protein